MSAFSQLNQVPGPGAYEPEKYQRNTKISYSMARKYDEKPSNINPGPGSYKKKSFIDPIANPRKRETFSRQTRENTSIVKEQKNTPAPGMYAQKSFLKKQGVVISPLRPETEGTQSQKQLGRPLQQSEKMYNPGPGSYSQKAELFKVGNNIIIGQAKREQEDKEKLSIPGPATYGYEKQSVKLLHSVGNITIGKDERRSPQDETVKNPGPGTYKAQAKVGGPAFSMPGKYPAKDDNHVPGPGLYNQQQYKIKLPKPPAYGIGTGPKEAPDFTTKRCVPGPGQYDQKSKTTHIGAKIGNDTRFRYDENKNPGPGSYRLPTMVAPVASYLLKNNNTHY